MANGINPVEGRYRHLNISGIAEVGEYRRPARKITKKFVRADHDAHGAELERQLAQAYADAAASHALRDPTIMAGEPGIYLYVESLAGQSLEPLELRSKKIRLAALHETATGAESGALFLPDEARREFERRIAEYRSKSGANRPNATHARFEPVQRIALGDLNSLWTSPRPFPAVNTWFEVWCYGPLVGQVAQVIERLRLQVSNERLVFPDFTVLFVHADPAQIRRLVWNCGGAVFQLRLGMDNPHVFTRAKPRAQHDWVENARNRLVLPPEDAPVVTLLDLGVTRAHPLLEPFISQGDAMAYHVDWGADDHDQNGHGTNMAGSALFGDLTYAMGDASAIEPAHRLESVKILPPGGVNPPNSYGVVTQAAVALAEIANPDRHRTFCCAVTSDAQASSRPTTWSAAVDQICSGAMQGDEGAEAIDKPKRLVVLASGNIAGHKGDQSDHDLRGYPIEDPAQSWNAITVGGFTEKIQIDDAGYEGYEALATAGARSPYSRTSIGWDDASTPIKPEVMLEAGNLAINRTDMDCVEGLESLSILTTGKDLVQRPLVEFNMTSAAVAQAARMTAAIEASDPDLWPETVRALLVHSADWREPMREALNNSNRQSERIAWIRQFGYGVPILGRALASARNDVALVAQNTIQPFRRKIVTKENGARSFSVITNEIHYYQIPWPREAFERIYDQTVRLKVTLSYYVEPNPGAAGTRYARTYQSFALRFDLKRRDEDRDAFRAHVNELESVDEEGVDEEVGARVQDEGWLLGPKSISAGSLHCDVWEGSAADLATRDEIAIYPITGWWKTRGGEKRYNDRARYSLVMSLDARGIDVDVYTPIAAAIAIAPAVEIEVE
jgi:Subtilase family